MTIAAGLIKGLRSRDVNRRRAAAESAGRHLCLAWPAIPALVRALDDKDHFVRRHAAQSLGKLGPASKAAVARLTELIADKDDVLAEAACWALGRIGAPARAALPALRRAARRKLPRDPEKPDLDMYVGNTRAAARAAMSRIGMA